MAISFDNYFNIPATGSSNGNTIQLPGVSSANSILLHNKGISETHKLWIVAKNKAGTSSRVAITINGVTDIHTIPTYAARNVLGPDRTFFGNEGTTISAHLDNGGSGDITLHVEARQFQAVTTV